MKRDGTLSPLYGYYSIKTVILLILKRGKKVRYCKDSRAHALLVFSFKYAHFRTQPTKINDLQRYMNCNSHSNCNY